MILHINDYVESMTEDEKVSFIETHYDSDIVDTDGDGCDYTIEIPQEIVDLASEEK